MTRTMNRWAYTIEVKDLFEDGDDDEIAARIGPKVAERIAAVAKRVKDEGDRETLEDIAFRFDTCAEQPKHACDNFNSALEELYDFGDSARIWIK